MPISTLRTGPAFLLVLLAAVASCRSVEPLPELHGGVEIGLRRGSAWSTYTVKPPHVIGSRGTLKLARGQLTGAIEGRQISLKVEPDGLTGVAGGNVEVEIYGESDKVEVSGLWASQRVHFTITPDAMRGTIFALSGAGQCQYVLDRTSNDGSRAGISICSGLPEDTMIELPTAVSSLLTRNELTAVLLSLLSSPPQTAMEGGLR